MKPRFYFILILLISHISWASQPINNATKSIEKIKWQFKTQGKIFSSPTIYKNTIFIGSEDGYLYAINKKTGHLKWKFKTNGAVHATPKIQNQTVYFLSYDGYFYAIHIHTGALKWKFKTNGEFNIAHHSTTPKTDTTYYDPWDCYLSSASFAKINGSTCVFFGSSDGHVYALNTNNGQPIWSFNAKGIIHSSPTIHNNKIFIGNANGVFYAIDATNGKEIWKYKTGEQPGMSGILASAVVHDGKVIFGAKDAHLYALDENNGHLKWRYNAGIAWIIGTAIIKNNTIYVGTSDSYLLLAIDAATGVEKEKFNVNGYIFATPTIYKNNIYIGDFTGRIFEVSEQPFSSFSNSWSTLSRSRLAKDILKNDKIDFLFASKGKNLDIPMNSVRTMDDIYSLGSFASSPLVEKGIMYIGSADGNLYAFELNK
ncbi:MAG: pyrrolo-quinoline quinone [Chitinophagaceae bacterium]|nr:MAG: pyrrolo-quinoline quinone [Chitinophagaceae bacterium]